MVYGSGDVVYTTSILYYCMVYDSGDVDHVVAVYCITVGSGVECILPLYCTTVWYTIVKM